MVLYLKLLRPHQWLKNLILLFPPFLGGSLFLPGVLDRGLFPFISFCLASSATYIFNDIRDRKNDSCHPRKRMRGIASRAIPVRYAVFISVGLLLFSLVLSFSAPGSFVGWLLAYLFLAFAYSFGLKEKPLVDIFCIASGFVFRLCAGGAAFGVKVSDWLFLSVLLLSLFLSSGKRLAEKKVLGSASGDHRKSLVAYPEGVLEGVMFMSGAAVLVTYTMYVIAKHKLVFTVPLCCFGLFRYLMLVKSGESGDPTDSLIKDPIMAMVGFAWVVMVGGNIYFWG